MGSEAAITNAEYLFFRTYALQVGNAVKMRTEFALRYEIRPLGIYTPRLLSPIRTLSSSLTHPGNSFGEGN